MARLCQEEGQPGVQEHLQAPQGPALTLPQACHGNVDMPAVYASFHWALMPRTPEGIPALKSCPSLHRQPKQQSGHIAAAAGRV